MQIAVQHKLQIFDPGDASLCEKDAFVMPMRDPVNAVMGETISQFLIRAEWRFDLPTICIVNGECYMRAEWETYALAVNDNVEFVSRPLGSSAGSTAKSVTSILALVALSAVTGPAGAIGGALATSFGAEVGAVLGAVVIGVGAAPLAAWLMPPAPWWRRKLKAARDSLRSVLAVASRFWSIAR